MQRIDSGVHLMAANEKQAEAIEKALEVGPIVVATSSGDAPYVDSFLVVLVHESEPEAHINKALRILS